MNVLTTRFQDHFKLKTYQGYVFETYPDNMKGEKNNAFSLADEAVIQKSFIRFITMIADQIRKVHPTTSQFSKMINFIGGRYVALHEGAIIHLQEVIRLPPGTLRTF